MNSHRDFTTRRDFMRLNPNDFVRGGFLTLRALLVVVSFGLCPATISAAPTPAKATSRQESQAQRLASLHVTQWHAEGFRGQHVKVAVLDSGFRGYRSQLGKA